MASCKEMNYINEWQSDEEAEINTGGEEEAGRLTRSEAWFSCKKLRTDLNYHWRYIPLKDALGFRDLSIVDKEKFVEHKGLTEEDKLFLESEKALECLERLADAVVCVKVKSYYGTGFFIRMNETTDYDGDIVITNSHTIRTAASGNGSNFSVVQPGDIRVISFYDGTERGSQICREVVRIGKVSAPDKNKDKDTLLRRTKAALYGDGTAVTETTEKLISLFDQLAPVLTMQEAYLDYAFLFLKPLDDEEEKRRFAKLRPLEIKAFKTTEHFRNVSFFDIPDPESFKLPRSLRLFTISHPHRASKQVSFGAMESTLHHVYVLNLTYGQNDTDSLEGKDPFLDHSIATCPGSSGAPVFMYFINHKTREVEIDDAVYFLHFCGSELDGKLGGKAISFATVNRHDDFEAN